MITDVQTNGPDRLEAPVDTAVSTSKVYRTIQFATVMFLVGLLMGIGLRMGFPEIF